MKAGDRVIVTAGHRRGARGRIIGGDPDGEWGERWRVVVDGGRRWFYTDEVRPLNAIELLGELA